MFRSLYSAGSGMIAQQMNVDNIAHNLANANTTGFKCGVHSSTTCSTRTWSSPAPRPAPKLSYRPGCRLAWGTRPAADAIIFTQGNFVSTGNPLDLVVQGKGLLQIRRPTGELAYTRDGAFHLDRDGNVVTSDGDPLEPQITLPPEAQSITIASDGTVSFSLQGRPPSSRLDKSSWPIFPIRQD